MRFGVAIGLLLVAAFAVAKGQEGWQVGQPWTGGMGITRTIAELRASALQENPRQKAEAPEEKVQRNLLPNPDAPAVSQWPPVKALAGAATATPLKLGRSWDGPNLAVCNVFPPDSMGAVGPSQFLACENARIRLYSKAGVLQGLDEDTQVFFQSVIRSGFVTTDPRVRYDPLSQRWFVVMIDFERNVLSPNDVLLAVSSGPILKDDSSFTFFKFQFDLVGPTPNVDTGLFLDQPSLGIDNNALYIGGNIFTSGGAFKNTSAFVVRKSSVLGAGPIVVTAFRGLIDSNNNGMYTPVGVEDYDASATSGLFLGTDGKSASQIDFRQIADPGGTPSISPTIALTVPITASPDQVATSGGVTVDANDDRITHAELKLNKLTGKKSLWTSHHILVNSQGIGSPTGDRVGTRWYEIDASGTAPVLLQSGTVFDSASTKPKSYWMGAIGMSGRGTVAFASTSAGLAEHLEISMAGRASGDPLGILSTPTVIQPSSFDYFGGRWGDYSYVSVDPADDMTLWTVQEYCDATNDWCTRIIQLLGAPPPTPVNISPNVVARGTSTTLSLTADTSNGRSFFDPGRGFPNHILAFFSGAPGVKVTWLGFVDAGRLKMNITVDPAAPTGFRNLTIYNPDGQATAIDNFLTIVPTSGTYLSQVSVNPFSVFGGNPGTGTVTLTNATATAATVQLASGSSSLVLPPSASVPANSSTGTFPITTSTVTTPTPVTVFGTFNGFSQSCNVTVEPPGVTSVAINPLSMVGGAPATGQATVGVATASGQTVRLTSSNPAAATVPSTVGVAGSSTMSSTFQVTTFGVATSTQVTITASENGIAASHSITLLPASLSKLQPSKTTLTGGDVITLFAALNGKAPQGGAVVTLVSTHPELLAVPSSTTVPFNSVNGPILSITSNGPITATSVTVTGTYSGISKTAVFQINPPVLSSLVLSPTTLPGGQASFGSVNLSGNVVGGNVTVTLSSTNKDLADPGTSATIFSGSNSNGVLVKTNNVAANTNVTITASLGSISKPVVLTLTPPTLDGVNLPNSIAGGDIANGTVTINGNAPPSGLTIAMSYGSLVSGPRSVFIGGGQDFTPLAVTTSGVSVNTKTTVSATFGGVTKTHNMTLTPPTLASISTNGSTTVGGGQSVSASVNLDGVAPNGGVVVQLRSTNTALAQVQSSVTIPASAKSAPITITTSAVTSQQNVSIVGTLGTTSQQLDLTLVTLALSSLQVVPSSVVYGGSAQGTVTVAGTVPSNGATITLSTNNNAAILPQTVTVPFGKKSVNFTVNTQAPQFTSTFQIFASFNGQTINADFTVQVPFVTVLLFQPSTVKGGNPSTATIGINVAAPKGGFVIGLSTDNTNVATVPSTVTIPEGQTQTTFPVTTKPVTVQTTVNIKATVNGSNTTSGLTVTP